MPPSDEDRVRLQHMLDAANEVIQFTSDRHREDLDTDRLFLRGLSMSVGIIGEAASRIEKAYRDKHDHVPWGAIIGMRNFIIHAYFKLDGDVLWNTATISFPKLIPQLQELLSETEIE